MSPRDRATLTSGVAVLLALTAFGPVFDGTGWVLRTAGAVVLPLAVLALARRLRLPGALAPLLGLLVLAGYLVAALVPATLSAGVLPGRETARALRALLVAAGEDLDQYGPPAPATAALVLLLAGGAGLVALAVDALAGALHRPAAAGVPLLALFAVPSALLPGGLGWLPFALGACGWLALLLAESREQVGRWGTALRRSEDAGDPTGLTRVGRRIGGAALAVAVLVPALLPGLHARLLDGGSGGGGGGGGSRSVVTYNPITRLRGELTLPVPVDVLTYRTDDPEPDYLRMTTLGVYDGGGWRQEVLRGNLRDDGVDDPVPLPVGRTSVTATRDVTATVRVAALDAFWLPVPATPTKVDVKGPWMWDPATQSVFATRSNTSQVGPYTVRSARVLPDPSLLAVGDGPLPPEIAPYAAPVEATDAVRALTARTVRGATTTYAKAAAIQAFFRNPANRFVYSEQTDDGGSPDALEAFLSRRRGFCEQYASAMAAMLRLAGVPSRVAVGFTPGVRQADGSYRVTTDEAHAWPEAWFDGAGWIRFEPTPSRGGISAPTYATPVAPAPALPGASAAPSAPTDDAPREGETAAERKERLAAEADSRQLDPGAAAPVASAQGSGAPLWVLVAVPLLLLLALPGATHVLRRRARWRRPDPELAWQQVREDAADCGYGEDASASPRRASAELVRVAWLDEAATAALGRVAHAVEQARYGRPGAIDAARDGLRADTAAVRRALRRGCGPRARLRAVLLPPSTVRWATTGSGRRAADLLDAGDRALSALAARARLRGSA